MTLVKEKRYSRTQPVQKFAKICGEITHFCARK